MRATTPDEPGTDTALDAGAGLAVTARPIAFAALSVLAHAALTWAMPSSVTPPAAPEPPSMVAFQVDPRPEPEPEPAEQPEPAPEPEPEPEPIEQPEPVAPRPEPEPPDEEPEPEPQPAQPEPERDPEEPSEPVADEPAGDGREQGERQTVASTEGGLGVDLPEGPGGGGHGSGTAGKGTGSGRGAARAAAPPRKPRIDPRALVQKYMLRIARLLRAKREVPLAVRRARLEGTVVLAITIAADGTIHGVKVARSSGHDALDRAARETADGLDRVPAPPDVLDWRTRAVKLPLSYRRN